MKLSNLEITEKSINVQENDKDVQENDMLLAEVRRQVNPISVCACTHFVQRIQITPHRTSAEERDLKAGRGSPITDRRSHKVCDRLRSYGNYFCDRLRSCDRDRRRSQKIEPCSISCDRLRSIAICDRLRSYGNQPLHRTWFYLLRSSAITIAGSQTIAEVVSI